ncbi:hypothetical protein QQ020_22985 [Fulvivirgaceae bacterium BMA12]|uniref:Uncharacterized protein n=1 Tax=Agaribacillus aureus TaxID=3051825 RepID=A0ABT8LB28_9BACT|nr:hypothetical protein [Fulvivirgaceae bacterium BMA12]
MKTQLLIILVTLLANCSTVTSSIENDTSEKVNYGNNIVILSDLSNRILRKKSIHDTIIISSVIDKLKPLIEKSVELNIYDKFNFYSVNHVSVDRIYSDDMGLNFNIDLTTFNKNELDISNYLYGRIEQDYDSDITDIKTSINLVYDHNMGSEILGADIWHYFNDELDHTLIDTTTERYTFQNKTYATRKKNKVILLTDGYIEAGRYANDPTMFDKKNPNQSKYLSAKLLNQFRINFNNSSYQSPEEFFAVEKYGLIPLQNPLIDEIELLVLEIDDRTIVNGVTTVSPPDSKIIKLFWAKWLKDSGMKPSNFQIYERFKNERELDLVLSNFLNQ